MCISVKSMVHLGDEHLGNVKLFHGQTVNFASPDYKKGTVVLLKFLDTAMNIVENKAIYCAKILVFGKNTIQSVG